MVFCNASKCLCASQFFTVFVSNILPSNGVQKLFIHTYVHTRVFVCVRVYIQYVYTFICVGHSQ